MASLDNTNTPSLEELAAAYRRGLFWQRGISLELALASPLLRQVMEGNAKHYHRKEEQAHGHALPVQTNLI